MGYVLCHLNVDGSENMLVDVLWPRHYILYWSVYAIFKIYSYLMYIIYLWIRFIFTPQEPKRAMIKWSLNIYIPKLIDNLHNLISFYWNSLTYLFRGFFIVFYDTKNGTKKLWYQMLIKEPNYKDWNDSWSRGIIISLR